jgi:hypothetical protein
MSAAMIGRRRAVGGVQSCGGDEVEVDRRVSAGGGGVHKVAPARRAVDVIREDIADHPSEESDSRARPGQTEGRQRFRPSESPVSDEEGLSVASAPDVLSVLPTTLRAGPP